MINIIKQQRNTRAVAVSPVAEYIKSHFAVIAIFALIAISAVFLSCSKPSPQTPANKVQKDDSSVALALMNMKQVEKANFQCAEYVNQDSNTYQLSPTGFWYFITNKADNQAEEITEDKRVEIFYTVGLFDGTLIEDTQTEFIYSANGVKHNSTNEEQHILLPCFQFMLPLLKQGEEMTAVVPYYLAYGKDGQGKVEPLTNCIIKVYVKNIQ